MGHIGQERSMEEILSSIKRVIAEGADPERAPRRGREPDILPDEEEDENVLELTQQAEGEPFAEGLPEPVSDIPPWREDALPEDEPQDAAPPEPAPPEQAAPAPIAAEPDRAARPAPQAPAPAPAPADDVPLVSPAAADAARQALAALGRMKVRPDAGDGTLEGLVRDMLRPMLADWLDANLPPMVERLVAAEVARLAGNIRD